MPDAADDAATLAALAARVVSQVVLENDIKHGRTWVVSSEYDHLAHAEGHLFPDPPTDEDLHHALCRLAMVIYLRENPQAATQ